LTFLNVNEQGFKVAMGGYRVIIMDDSHWARWILWCAPNSLRVSNVNPKQKTTKGQRIGARSLVCSTLEGVEGHAGAVGLD